MSLENSSNPVSIRLSGLGNVGNRMMQYMAAVGLSRVIDGAYIEAVHLPEWGESFVFSHPAVETDNVLRVSDNELSLSFIDDNLDRTAPAVIHLTEFAQKIDLFGDHGFFQDVFSQRENVDINFSDDELVVSIRAGELLEGLEQYPLIPIDFYRRVQNETGLRLVFVGQMAEDGYSQDLRDAFPDARFIPHVTPMQDFELLRRAKNVVVGISTFSFLATWLSDAKKIILPLWGFFSVPCYLGAIDLLPLNDSRYDFWFFPYVPGLPEAQMRTISSQVIDRSRPIGVDEIRAIQERAAMTKAEPNIFSVDEQWYASRYLDVAEQVALGFYRDGVQHYNNVGVWEGRLAAAPRRLDVPNVAFGKRAVVSSISEFAQGETVEAQGSAAINGPVEGDCAFHTQLERNPEWRVDLGACHEINQITIFNRNSLDFIRARCLPLRVDVSEDGQTWHFLARCKQLFGGADGHPLEITVQPTVKARHVRLFVEGEAIFHLLQVQVFGICAE